MTSLAAGLATAIVAIMFGTYLDGVMVLLPSQRQLSARSYIEQEQANTTLGTIRYRVLIAVTMATQF